ncbi:hypothetical protein AB0I54_42825 [Streptomyces sp. NPDC050625]|uniref:hypothetical protein n=1 Tax=Streptomyces sp. NPDC050625 TaxID=3154629 RepID=UPI00342C5731
MGTGPEAVVSPDLRVARLACGARFRQAEELHVNTDAAISMTGKAADLIRRPFA